MNFNVIAVVKKEREKISESTEKIIKYRYWLLASIILVTGLLYSNSLKNDFTTFDDVDYILDNPHIKDCSWQGIEKIFTTFYASNYHPLTTMMWMLEYCFFGSNAFIFHLMNLFFHLINIILVYILVRQLLKDDRKALLVSLLFALHPMHVESVSWISERKDVLYAFFFLGSLIFYQQYLKKNYRLKFLVLSFVMFVLSVLSKSAAISLIAFLLIVDYFYQRKMEWRIVIEKIPFLILSVSFGLLALASQDATIHADITPAFPFYDRIFFASYGIAYYFLMAIFPFHFSALHFYPEKSGGMLPLEYYLSFIFILLLIWMFYKVKTDRKLLVTGMGIFISGFIMVLQFIPVGQAVVAERYTYIPYLGIFIIAAELIFKQKAWRKFATGVLFSFLIVYYSAATFSRNAVWKDSISLFKDVEKKYPESYYANYALANAYMKNGNTAQAMKYFSRSVKLNPSFIDNYNNRGVLRNKTGDYIGAVEDHTTALKNDSLSSYTWFNRGMAYFNLKEFQLAVSDFDHAIRIWNDFADAYFYRGNAKSSMKKYTEAMADYEWVIRIDSTYGMAYANLATTQYNLNNREAACKNWKKAVDCGFTDANDMLDRFCK